MIVVDVDGHVEESKATFSFLEKEYYARRPIPLGFDRDTACGPFNAVWLIDGNVYPKITGRGGFIFRTPTTMEAATEKTVSIAAQEMTDVKARLRDLDKAGIDKQVVYPTLFIAATAEDVKLEAALFRSYNSFMGDACSKSEGRIKFAALVPMRDMKEATKELRRAKALGAASVMTLGVAWDKSLGDEALYPLYEEAASINIPVCIHTGWGCPALTNIFDTYRSFNSARLPVLMGFQNIMHSGVLDAFPKLTLAFLESGSLWVPYVINQLRRNKGKCAGDPAAYFRNGRIYVACDADENINYLTEVIGEDCVVTGSDYPHLDPSTEENMIQTVMSREDVPLRVREKILSDNPRRLYGL